MTKRHLGGFNQGMIYGASIALMKGVSLLILPFITHHLSTEEFGQLEVISTLAIIGSVLVGMGLEDTLFRFAGTASTSQQRRHIAADIFSLTLLLGIVSLSIGWFAAGALATWMPGDPSVYQIRLVLSVLALEGCIAIPLGWLRMNNQTFSFFIITCGRALVQAILVVASLYLGRGVAGVLEAGVIAAVVQTLILSYLHIRDTGFHCSLKTGKRSFIYSLPIVGSGLVAFALNGIDRWILAENATLTDVAEFGVATKFALATVLLLQPFGMWWSPRRFEVLNGTQGREKVAHFIALGATLALLIAVIVGLTAPLLINWLLPTSYSLAGQYAVGLVLVMLVKELVELFNMGCFTGDTTGSQLIINILGATVGLTSMFLLTPSFQVWGIITSLLLAQCIRLLCFYNTSQHFLPLRYPLGSLLMLTGLCMFWLLLSLQLATPGQSVLTTLIATASILTAAHLLKLITLPIHALKRVAE